ncbi:hypothetical protein Hdeb2414_s0122g00803811 [Helianthus debilis subsp. tardiflorus]
MYVVPSICHVPGIKHVPNTASSLLLPQTPHHLFFFPKTLFVFYVNNPFFAAPNLNLEGLFPFH